MSAKHTPLPALLRKREALQKLLHATSLEYVLTPNKIRSLCRRIGTLNLKIEEARRIAQ